MAAVFYSLQPNKSIFKDGLDVITSIRVPFLDGLVGAAGNAIISAVSINNADTVQFFLTFDDLISYFYFGKGLGTMTIAGSIFTDCSGGTPGVNVFYERIARFRGTPVYISFGNVVFTAIISNYNIEAVADPVSMVNFSIQLGIINHSLPRPFFPALC